MSRYARQLWVAFAGRNVTNRVKAGNATGRTNAYAVMHIGGDTIPEVQLQFTDETVGIPWGVHAIARQNRTSVTLGKNREAGSLSAFLEKNGPGVYYMLSCRSGDGYGSKNSLDVHVERTRRARERMRPTSDPMKFDAFNSEIHKMILGQAHRNYEKNSFAARVLSGVSIERENAYVKQMIAAARRTAAMNEPGNPVVVGGAFIVFAAVMWRIGRVTHNSGAPPEVVFVKGGSMREMSGIFAKYLGILSPVRIFATRRAWMLAAMQTKARILESRKRAIARMLELRKNLQMWLIRKKEPLAAKYGFDVNNRVKLDQLRANHEKRLMGNRAALREMHRAHETAVFRLVSNNPRTAGQFMKAWGFEPGMTRNAIEKTAVELRATYTRKNWALGRIPKQLAMAKNLALRFSA